MRKLSKPLKRATWLKTLAGILIGAGLSLQLASAQSNGTAPKNPEQPPRTVWLAEIRGTVNPATASYLSQTIRLAERDEAQAVIVEMDTPGGLLASTRTMAQAMAASRVPVVIFVTPSGASATSAGALLMLASHVAAMSPGTNIGAAHPVGPQGEEAKGAMGDKILSDTSAFARGLAEVRDRNVKLAERVVSESLSMTADEALKQNFIEIVVPDRSALFAELDGRTVEVQGRSLVIRTENSVVKTAEMTAGQNLLHYLANPNIAAVLMGLGMLLIYVEISNPGLTIAGILGGVCILTAFVAFQVLPIRTGGLVLLLLGLGLMIAEPFVGSGGILAGGGLLAFVLGLLWVVDPSETDMRIHPRVWIPLTVGMGLGIGIIAVAAARTRKMSAETLSKIGGTGAAGLEGYRGQVSGVSDDGLSGSVAIRGEHWTFESETPVKPGDWVEAQEVRGLCVRVRPSSPPIENHNTERT